MELVGSGSSYRVAPVVHMFPASSEEGKDVVYQSILETLPSALHGT